MKWKSLSPHRHLISIMSEEHVPPSINPSATIAPTAVIGTAPVGVAEWTLPPAVVEGDTHIGDYTIVHAAAIIRVGSRVDTNCTIGARAEVKARAVIRPGCHVGPGAVIGEGAGLGAGCVIGEECAVGTGASLGPGVVVLALPRLPPRKSKVLPGMVGADARIGGGAVVCGGVRLGKRAIVAAGEVVEDDVPDDGVYMGGRVAAQF